MALGNIKGEYVKDPHLKTRMLEALLTRDYVEKAGSFGNFGFWIKIKETKYKYFLMPNKMVTPRPIPYEFGKLENHIDGNSFVVQTTGKYFHDMLEIVPQILTLKKAGEKFKLILLSNQQINPETKMFYGMSKTDEMGYQPISYWLDILKFLKIDFECKTAKIGDAFSTESNYLFYYTDFGIEHGTGLGGPDTNRVRTSLANIIKDLNIDHSYIIFPLMYFTTFIHADSYDILYKSLKGLAGPVIPGKKIFITRDSAKFADRSIKNSKELTDFMRDKGFEIFNQEDYVWQEQIKKITSAEYIVSLVGSGFINAMFCGPDTTIISIHTDKSQDFLTYANQSGRVDIDFKTVYCDPDGLDIIRYLTNSKSKITRKVMDSGN